MTVLLCVHSYPMTGTLGTLGNWATVVNERRVPFSLSKIRVSMPFGCKLGRNSNTAMLWKEQPRDRWISQEPSKKQQQRKCICNFVTCPVSNDNLILVDQSGSIWLRHGIYTLETKGLLARESETRVGCKYTPLSFRPCSTCRLDC